MALSEKEISASIRLSGHEVMALAENDVIAVTKNGTPIDTLGYTVPAGKAGEVDISVRGSVA